MEKSIIWYASGIDSSCDIIGTCLNKHSKNKFIKTRWNEGVPHGDIFIGSYRYFDDDLIYVDLVERFGEKNLYIYAHGISKEESQSEKIFKENWEERSYKCHKILVSSNYTYDFFLKSGIETEILPFGVDLKAFPYKEKPKRDKPIFGMAFAKGKGHRKGQDFAYECMEKFDLKIVFSNHRYQQMHEFYHFIDCLLVLSEEDGRETFCLPVLEAGACGTPVFTTQVGIGKKVIKTGETGFIGNKHGVIEAINSYSNNYKLMEMGKKLHSEVKNNWSWEKMARWWDDFFE